MGSTTPGLPRDETRRCMGQEPWRSDQVAKEDLQHRSRRAARRAAAPLCGPRTECPVKMPRRCQSKYTHPEDQQALHSDEHKPLE